LVETLTRPRYHAPVGARLQAARRGELGADDVVDDRFVIERHAGSGGVGVVYRALDLRTMLPVALKVLKGRPGPEAELRFEREALALAELDHPGVVRYVVHGIGADGRAYLAMEWIEGESLRDRLERGPLSLAEALAFGLPLAEALGATHARGTVHRDLKPSNILLPDGALDRAKIVDFGLTRFPKAIRVTVSGVVVGTPGYMAPEQARGVRAADVRADVFSLGCILHECLTGKPAFDGDCVMAVLEKIAFVEVPPLRGLGCAVPAALDALVSSMLSKAPAARPPDARAVARALAAINEQDAEAPASRAPLSASLTRAVPWLVCIIGSGA
jgi:serine/threonine protein kinase